MVYYVGAGAWKKTYQARDSCGSPESETRYGRKHKKKTKRSYRHFCVGIQINSNGDVVGRDNEVAYNGALEGHHPCKGLGTSTYLGGGSDSGGNGTDFSGRVDNYYSSHLGFKCTVADSKMTSANLKAWSGSKHMNDVGGTGAGAKQNGTRKTLWKQLVMGANIAGVNSPAFCEKVENLSVVVHNDGKSCYDMIGSELKATNRKQFCDKNETDEKCACRNVSHYGTKECVNDHPTLPGCAEVKAAYDQFPAKAVTETPPIGWTPSCFASGI